MQRLWTRRWKAWGEARRFGQEVALGRAPGSRSWLSPVQYQRCGPELQHSSTCSASSQLPQLSKTPLSGAVKLVLASIWLYPRNKLLCLSPRLEHLLWLCTSASDPAHGSPDAPWRSSELPQAVCSHSRAVPASDTTPAHLQARRCKGEAGDTLPALPSFAFQPQAAVSASEPPNPQAVL